MKNILVAVTGSVATVKLPILIEKLAPIADEIRIVATQNAFHFFSVNDIPSSLTIYKDSDEWTTWSKLSDPVLHIELRKWADMMVIAPLDANTLAKIANGLCDNLLTCIIRAWDCSKPIILCPAMNTYMWHHPMTQIHLNALSSLGESVSCYHIIGPVSKQLACGDFGMGGMADVDTIVINVKAFFGKEEENNTKMKEKKN